VLRANAFEEVARCLAGAAAEGRAVRVIGGGTKVGWGQPGPAGLELSTAGLDRIVEHNAGDLTAVLEAGVPFARAQDRFAGEGQMLALDPPLGEGDAATIGGVVATADSGPLRHRYGAPRDLVVGITVALSDGTIARAGGKVIKNVAGYDLAKLFAGSFGTLGVILSVSVRLHPLPAATATAVGSARDADELATAARALAAAPLELDSLDVWWRDGEGELLARCAGAQPGARAGRAAAAMRDTGLRSVDVVADDAAMWERQREAQRSASRAVVRVGARPSALAEVIRATAAAGGFLAGRGALGIAYAQVDPEAIARLRAALPRNAFASVLDHPGRVSGDPWGRSEGPALELMRSVKRRFDPAGVCNPGVFVVQ
jgi:glycolate oxidase FAD binding subunit